MSLEKLDSGVRKEQIAQAVLALVASRGIRGLSVAGVARRIGLVPSAIYRHYRSKDQAIDAALDLIGERLLGNVRVVCGEHRGALERLEALLFRHMALIRENRAIPRIVFSEEVFHGSRERKEKVWGIIGGYLEAIAEVIRKGQEERLLRTDADPGTLATMFLGLIQPAAILWILSSGRFDIDRHARVAWKVYRGTIRSPIPRIRKGAVP